MEDEQRLPVAEWRLVKVAPVALEVAPRHRDTVFGVAALERELAPNVAALLASTTVTRTFEAKRKATLAQHDANLVQLRRRTRFWLTYVRMTLTHYDANEVPGRLDSADVIIDRARGVVAMARSYAEGAAPDWAAPALAELAPLYEQCVAEQTLERDLKQELQHMEQQERALWFVVYRGVNTLRVLLSNALGSNHADVRALKLDPPARRKKAVTEVTQPQPQPLPQPEAAPTTAERLALRIA